MKYIITVIVGALIFISSGFADGKKSDIKPMVKKKATTAEQVAEQITNSFKKADAEGMAKYCAGKVNIIRNPRLKGKVTPEHTKEEFTKAYSDFFKIVGKDKWIKLVKNIKPTVKKATKEDQVIKGVKKGDYIVDLHFRESYKKNRRGLDEAVIFILQKIDNEFQIVIHYADY